MNRHHRKTTLAGKEVPAVLRLDTSTIYDAWQLSFQALDRPTSELLLMCSYFSSDEIPVDMLYYGIPRQASDSRSTLGLTDLERALRSRWDDQNLALNCIGYAKRADMRAGGNLANMVDTLTAHSMIRRTQRAHQSFIMHRIIQEWARDLQDPDTKRILIERAIHTVANSLRAIERNWEIEQYILPHIIACLRWAEKILVPNTQLIRHQDWSILGHVCKINCRYDEAEKLFKLALEDKGLTENHGTDMAKILLDLGSVYEAQKHLTEAELLYRSALKLLKPWDETWTLEMDLLLSLAGVLTKRHGSSEAATIFDHVLAHSEEACGLNHPRTLYLVDVIAEKYEEIQEYENAEMLRRRELLYYEMHVGFYSPIIKNARLALAQICQKRGKYEAAAQIIKVVLLTQEKRLGPNHPSSFDLVSRLAVLCDLQGRFDESEDLHERALEGKLKALGADHPSTVKIMENMALNLRLRDDYEGAEELYLKILQRKKKTDCSPDDIEATAVRLADMYDKQGRFEDVKRVFERLDGIAAVKS